FVFRQAPWFLEEVEASIPNLLLEERIKINGLDTQTPAHHCQQFRRDFVSFLRRQRTQKRMRFFPLGLVLAALHKPSITDLKQLQLFKVGARDTPAPTQIVVKSITQHISKSTPSQLGRAALGARVFGVIRGLEVQVV